MRGPAGLCGGRWILAWAAAVTLLATGCVGPRPPERGEEDEVAAPENRLIVEDVSVIITSGTTTLRQVGAARATYFEDENYLEATTVTLELNLRDQNVWVKAEAARGEVFLATEEEKKKRGTEEKLERAAEGLESEAAEVVEDAEGAEQVEPGETIGYQAIQRLASLPREERKFGDVVLYGPVEGTTDNGGRFATGEVIWSERLKRLLVPMPFYLRFTPPEGGSLAMTGAAFEVDSTLRNWMCYGDTVPGRVLWGEGFPEALALELPAQPASSRIPGAGASGRRDDSTKKEQD
jgi:hypothetical protein